MYWTALCYFWSEPSALTGSEDVLDHTYGHFRVVCEQDPRRWGDRYVTYEVDIESASRPSQSLLTRINGAS